MKKDGKEKERAGAFCCEDGPGREVKPHIHSSAISANGIPSILVLPRALVPEWLREENWKVFQIPNPAPLALFYPVVTVGEREGKRRQKCKTRSRRSRYLEQGQKPPPEPDAEAKAKPTLSSPHQPASSML
jgi:hypothetical protein